MLRHNGKNNGEISMSVREAAERLNCSPRPAMNAFNELTEKGFIRPNQKGAFVWKQRHATTWIILEFPYGILLAKKDFMRWKPKKENT